jgi:hypothetical protein
MPQVAKINQTATWVCSGTSDTLTCSDISQIRNGVQIESSVSLATATVTVTLESGVTKVVTVAADDANVALIGKDFLMSQIVISNCAAATYTVRFSQ